MLRRGDAQGGSAGRRPRTEHRDLTRTVVGGTLAVGGILRGFTREGRAHASHVLDRTTATNAPGHRPAQARHRGRDVHG